MPNKSTTLIAVPADVSDPGQLRQFLVRLVIELDKALGNRGDENAVTLDELKDEVSQLKLDLQSHNSAGG